MKRMLALFVLVLYGVVVTHVNAAELIKKPLHTLPSFPSKPQQSLPASAQLPSLFVLNAPNGGEKWVAGTQHEITWARSSDITGNITIDLYRGGTAPQNKVGTIAAGIPATSGKYSWLVGSMQGGTAPPSGDYRIVIGAASKTDASNGSFSIISIVQSGPASLPAAAVKPKTNINTAAASSIKGITWTYPRRADGFHKGFTYKMTWKSFNLSDARLKIELLNNQETTVISTLANNVANTSEAMWFVPMNLPDESTFYKLRIQTMDGAHKDTVGPIRISKLAPPAGGPALFVKSPLTEPRAIGTTVPVKWMSAVSCSGNGGPLDDGFRIELMQGSSKVGDLTDVGYTFVSEGPGGFVNWSWNWEMMRGSIKPGTYSIRVTSMISPTKCINTSQTFRVFDPAPAPQGPAPKTDSVLLTNAQFTNKKHCEAERYSSDSAQPKCPDFYDVPPGQGRVGTVSKYEKLVGEGSVANQYELSYTGFRSKIYFPVNEIPMQNRKLKYANLQMKVAGIVSVGGQGLGFQLCGYALYRLNGAWNNYPDMPVDSEGIRVSNNQSTVNVNVTSLVGDWLTGAKPNNGFLLTNYALWPASPEVRNNACLSSYTATLYLEFEKTVLDKSGISKIPIPVKK